MRINGSASDGGVPSVRSRRQVNVAPRGARHSPYVENAACATAIPDIPCTICGAIVERCERCACSQTFRSRAGRRTGCRRAAPGPRVTAVHAFVQLVVLARTARSGPRHTAPCRPRSGVRRAALVAVSAACTDREEFVAASAEQHRSSPDVRACHARLDEERQWRQRPPDCGRPAPAFGRPRRLHWRNRRS